MFIDDLIKYIDSVVMEMILTVKTPTYHTIITIICFCSSNNFNHVGYIPINKQQTDNQVNK